VLVKRGITQSRGRNGVIEARLETEPFAVRNSVHGANLDSLPEWKAKVVLGILWSSLARYYFWMTAGSWGTWHHEIHEEDVMRLPIVFPEDPTLRRRILQLVDRLRQIQPTEIQPTERRPLLEAPARGARAAPQAEIDKLEGQLDDLVFQTYGLAGFERQLVNDMCQIGLDLFYRHAQSEAVKPLRLPDDFLCGRAPDMGGLGDDNDLGGYLRAFDGLWNQQLTPHGEFIWQVVRPGTSAPMIAVVLETVEVDGSDEPLTGANRHEWASLMRKLDDVSVQHEGSRRIFIDGVVRIVSETEIIIIKRNERRLWTASMAREDAEATIKQAIQLQEQQ